MAVSGRSRRPARPASVGVADLARRFGTPDGYQNDPESSPYDRYTPRLHKHAAALISEWCDAVLFATRKVRIQSEDAGFNRKRTIAHPIGKAGGDRILRCVGGPSCVAKNRYGITEELPLDWAAFIQAMSHSSQSASTGV